MTSLLIAVFIISSAAAVAVIPIKGNWAAIVLGFDVIATDLLLQWLRFKLIRGKQDNKTVLLGIFGGLAARIVFVIGFIRLGMWQLGFLSSPFYLFIILILSIPIWSVLLGLRLKKELP